MATANKAITGMGSVIGKVSKYSDWLGTTLDAKIEELIPGMMIPGATYDQALEGRQSAGIGAAAPRVSTEAGPGSIRTPEGDVTPGGWGDWSWPHDESSSKSK